MCHKMCGINYNATGDFMDYFPLSLASGDAFCNRTTEQKRLITNILESKPSLIVSPRRYGKTSLALQVIKKTKLDYAQFDFFSAVNLDDIEKIMLKGISKLLTRLEKGPRKLLQLASDLFSGLNIKISLDKISLSVELNGRSKNTADNILDLLERLEHLSEKYNKKIILLFDEFQRLYQISDDTSIEAVLRQVAQASKKLSFVFSGSNRHLLHKVFHDSNRPFYKLCDRLTLSRISEKDYKKYILKAASHYKVEINGNEINTIFECTKRHPYYINLLCSRIFRLKEINAEMIKTIWANYLEEERSQVANELDLISSSQRRMLITLARCGGIKSPRSQETIVLSGMPGSTNAQAMTFLEQKDYIYKDENDLYRILDPAIEGILTKE